MRWEDDSTKRLALLLGVLLLLGEAVARPPIQAGDAGEYLVMAESLFRHGTPDLRAADVRRLADLEARAHGPLNFADLTRGFFESPRGGTYSYHFWGFSLLTLPAKVLLRLFRLDELRAPSLTNALLLSLALALSLRARGGSARQWGLFLLSLFSPVLFFVRWPHTEAASFAFVLIALLSDDAGRPATAVLAASLAAMQNPPLLLLVLVLALGAAVRDRRPAALARLALAALPALAPLAFYYWKFGVPSLIGREAADSHLVSLRRFLELFLDPNLGLLWALPITLPLFLWVLVRGGGGSRTLVLRNALVLVVMAAGATATLNWNHGTTGPSRYTVWMLPLLFHGILPPTFTGSRLLAPAIVSQALLVLLHGGPEAQPDYLEHSFVSRAVLEIAPRLYNPTPEVFVERTLHREGPPEGPVVYKEGERCLKAYARPQDEDALRSVCGRAGTPRGPGWSYVDF
jgi:hypothetical protein